MKKLFTLISMVAFLAACGGNPNKKVAATEEEMTTAAVECTSEECKEGCKEGECTEDKTCCAAAEGEEVVVEEEVAKTAE